MKIKIYTPILKGKDGAFTVNGATDPDREKSVRKASMHVSIRDKAAEIIRVDIDEVDEDNWYNPKPY